MTATRVRRGRGVRITLPSVCCAGAAGAAVALLLVAGCAVEPRAAVSVPPPAPAAVAPPRTLADVRQVFDRNRPSFDAEFASAAAAGRQPADGRLDLTLTVQPDGTVSDVALLSSGFHDPVLEQALLDKVRGLRFEPRKGGAFRFPSYPIVYRRLVPRALPPPPPQTAATAEQTRVATANVRSALLQLSKATPADLRRLATASPTTGGDNALFATQAGQTLLAEMVSSLREPAVQDLLLARMTNTEIPQAASGTEGASRVAGNLLGQQGGRAVKSMPDAEMLDFANLLAQMMEIATPAECSLFGSQTDAGMVTMMQLLSRLPSTARQRFAHDLLMGFRSPERPPPAPATPAETELGQLAAKRYFVRLSDQDQLRLQQATADPNSTDRCWARAQGIRGVATDPEIAARLLRTYTGR